MASSYIAAIRHLAETGEAGDALFVRLTDRDVHAVSQAVVSDPTLCAAALHPHCVGSVDTFVLAMARQVAA